MMEVDSTREVQKDGINYASRKFISPLLPPKGTTVRLRHYPYEFDTIEVYDEHGEWLCTAKEPPHLTETELAQLFKRRGRQFREVKQAASLGHDLRNGKVWTGDGAMIADIPDKNDPNSNGDGDSSTNGNKTSSNGSSKRGADSNGTESSASPTSDADIDAALKGLKATP